MFDWRGRSLPILGGGGDFFFIFFLLLLFFVFFYFLFLFLSTIFCFGFFFVFCFFSLDVVIWGVWKRMEAHQFFKVSETKKKKRCL